MRGKINIKLILKIIVYVGGSLIAIYLILVASGYKFDKVQKKFVQTGAIYLNSNIKDDLGIYLNGKLKSKKTPLKIKYLLPGNYKVSIEKDGFKKWEKTLEVKPGLVSDETDIILFSNSPLEKDINQINGVAGFTLSNSLNEVMFWTVDSIYYQKIENGTPEIIYELSAGNIIDINANDNLDTFLIELKDSDEKPNFYFCNRRPCQESFDLNLGLNLNFESAKLTRDNKYPISGTAEGNLYLISADFEKTYLDSKVIDYDFYDNKIFYSKEREGKIIVASKTIEGTDLEIISETEIKGRTVAEAYSIFVDKKKNKMFIINKDGLLMEFDKGKKEFKELGCEATGLIFDNKNFLLVQNNNELWVQGKVVATDKEDSLHLVARYSSNIFDPGWLQRSNYILFIRDNFLRAVHIKSSNETELYNYKDTVNLRYSSLSYTQIIILDKGRLKNLKVTERGSFIDLW